MSQYAEQSIHGECSSTLHFYYLFKMNVTEYDSQIPQTEPTNRSRHHPLLRRLRRCPCFAPSVYNEYTSVTKTYLGGFGMLVSGPAIHRQCQYDLRLA